MSKKPSQFYTLIFAGNFLEDHPEIISYEGEDDHGFDDSLINKGFSLINSWPQNFTIHLRGQQPIDYFIGGIRYLFLSSSAADAINSLAKSKIELLPVNAILNDRFIGAGFYYVLNVLESFEALNWEATVWVSRDIPFGDPSAYFKIIKPAFNRQPIEGEHIFLLNVNDRVLPGIYISKYLKELLEKRKCSVGMEFMPIKTIDTDSLV